MRKFVRRIATATAAIAFCGIFGLQQAHAQRPDPLGYQKLVSGQGPVEAYAYANNLFGTHLGGRPTTAARPMSATEAYRLGVAAGRRQQPAAYVPPAVYYPVGQPATQVRPVRYDGTQRGRPHCDKKPGDYFDPGDGQCHPASDRSGAQQPGAMQEDPYDAAAYEQFQAYCASVKGVPQKRADGKTYCHVAAHWEKLPVPGAGRQ